MIWSLHWEEDCQEDITDEIKVMNSWVRAQLSYVSDTLKTNERGDFTGQQRTFYVVSRVQFWHYEIVYLV
jgi:hypothetical protein